MTEAVIVSAVRTPIGTSFKGSLTETTPAEMARLVIAEAVSRSGLASEKIDDVVLAESHYGGGDVARYAAIEGGLMNAPGQSVKPRASGHRRGTQPRHDHHRRMEHR